MAIAFPLMVFLLCCECLFTAAGAIYVRRLRSRHEAIEDPGTALIYGASAFAILPALYFGRLAFEFGPSIYALLAFVSVVPPIACWYWLGKTRQSG